MSFSIETSHVESLTLLAVCWVAKMTKAMPVASTWQVTVWKNQANCNNGLVLISMKTDQNVPILMSRFVQVSKKKCLRYHGYCTVTESGSSRRVSCNKFKGSGWSLTHECHDNVIHVNVDGILIYYRYLTLHQRLGMWREWLLTEIPPKQTSEYCKIITSYNSCSNLLTAVSDVLGPISYSW